MPNKYDWPQPLLNSLESCLEAEPDKRPTSAAVLARRLELATMNGVNELVRFRPGGWRDLASRSFPFAGACLMLSIAGLAPNLLTIILSLLFDATTEILNSELLSEHKLWVNVVILPIGFVVLFCVSLPAMAGFARVVRGRELPDWQAASRTAMSLAAWYAFVSFAGWSLCGVVYPVLDVFPLRHFFTPQASELTPTRFAEFFAYHLLLGLVTGSLVFLMVSVVTTRLLLPKLIQGVGSQETRLQLLRVGRGVDRYSAALGLFPPLALVIVALGGHTKDDSGLLVMLGIVGLFGFGLAVYLSPRIRQTVATLGVMLKSAQELIHSDDLPAN